MRTDDENVELKEFIILSLRKYKKLYLLEADEFISDLHLLSPEFTFEEAKEAFLELIKLADKAKDEDDMTPEAYMAKLLTSRIWKQDKRATDKDYCKKEKEEKKIYNKFQVVNKTLVNKTKNLQEKLRRKVFKEVRFDPNPIKCMLIDGVCLRECLLKKNNNKVCPKPDDFGLEDGMCYPK